MRINQQKTFYIKDEKILEILIYIKFIYIIYIIFFLAFCIDNSSVKEKELEYVALLSISFGVHFVKTLIFAYLIKKLIIAKIETV